MTDAAVTQPVEEKPKSKFGNLPGPGPGRKKGSKINEMKAEFKQLCLKASPQAFQVLLEIANDKKKPAAARVAAANSIIDRAHGKAIQTIVGDADSPPLVAVQVIYAGGQDIVNGNVKFQNLSAPLEHLELSDEDYETGEDD